MTELPWTGIDATTAMPSPVPACALSSTRFESTKVFVVRSRLIPCQPLARNAQRMMACADESRQQEASETHAPHEDAEKDAKRDRG